jgi:hypothetical protein
MGALFGVVRPIKAKALTSFAVESRALRESLFFERQRSAFQQPKGWSN